MADRSGDRSLPTQIGELWRLVLAYFRQETVEPVRNLVGSYITSLEMAGASLTLTALDDELTSLWDSPVTTPSLRW